MHFLFSVEAKGLANLLFKRLQELEIKVEAEKKANTVRSNTGTFFHVNEPAPGLSSSTGIMMFFK